MPALADQQGEQTFTLEIRKNKLAGEVPELAVQFTRKLLTIYISVDIFGIYPCLGLGLDHFFHLNGPRPNHPVNRPRPTTRHRLTKWAELG